MLLKTGYSLDYTVTVSFFYDNDEVVSITISTGDVIKASYNKNGKRVSIEGKVTRIYTQDNHAGHICHVASCTPCKNTGCYIIVDGSTSNNSELARIDVDTLLEVEILEKFPETESKELNNSRLEETLILLVIRISLTKAPVPFSAKNILSRTGL